MCAPNTHASRHWHAGAVPRFDGITLLDRDTLSRSVLFNGKQRSLALYCVRCESYGENETFVKRAKPRIFVKFLPERTECSRHEQAKVTATVD
jgi:hypothetical protein